MQTTGFANKQNINPANTWSLGLLQMDFFYRKKPWYAGQFVRKIIPKIQLNEQTAIYFTTLLNKQKKKLLSGLVRDVDASFKEAHISLPITSKGAINYDFMEEFIATLEEERVATIKAYLSATGLSDYTLTQEEQETLNSLYAVTWKEFRLGELFHEVMLKSIYPKQFNKQRDISRTKTAEFNLPLVNAKHGNNGIMYYGRSSDFESSEMTLGVVGDGAIATGNVNPHPQKTGILYNAYLIKLNHSAINKEHLFFFSTVVQKSIKLKFGYEHKANWKKVKTETISLPITSEGAINYDFMEKFTSAMQKITIKNVIEYLDIRLDKTKEITDKN